jgi:hypothetical protein
VYCIWHVICGLKGIYWRKIACYEPPGTSLTNVHAGLRLDVSGLTNIL